MFMADNYATLRARRQLQAERNAGVYNIRSPYSTYVHDFDLTNGTVWDSYNFKMEVHMWVDPYLSSWWYTDIYHPIQ